MGVAEARRGLARLRRCLDLEAHHLRVGFEPLAHLHRQARLLGDDSLAEAVAEGLARRDSLWFRQAWSTAWTDPAQLRVLRGHEGAVRGCALSADGAVALSASYDCTLRLWDAASGEPRAVLRGHEGAVNGCALSADGAAALSASADRTLRLWDAASGACRLVMAIDGLTSCALSADGRRVCVGEGSGNVSLFEVVAP